MVAENRTMIQHWGLHRVVERFWTFKKRQIFQEWGILTMQAVNGLHSRELSTTGSDPRAHACLVREACLRWRVETKTSCAAFLAQRQQYFLLVLRCGYFHSCAAYFAYISLLNLSARWFVFSYHHFITKSVCF